MEVKDLNKRVDCRLIVDGEQQTDFTDYRHLINNETGRSFHVMDCDNEFNNMLSYEKHESMKKGLVIGMLFGILVISIVWVVLG